VIRKDYLLKLLQQLDEAIKKINAKRGSGAYEEALQINRQAYQRLLGVDPEETKDLDYLLNEKRLEFDELNVMAELLTEEADSLLKLDKPGNALPKYNLALDIFEYLNEAEKVFSFEREARMAHIVKQLNSME
jgi:NurA-like 5'-3' nuclease